MFPPRPDPSSFKGRASELRTLAAACGRAGGEGARVALVGPGGCGKSALAAALGHRLRPAHPGGLEWFRIGAWDARTLMDMMGIRLGIPLGSRFHRERQLADLRRHLRARGRTFIVLDNHENDAATARLLRALADTPVTWVLTARRCLLGGVSVFPVVPPLVTGAGSPFPRVAALTSLLRWNPLALGICDALAASRATTPAALGAWLRARGLGGVTVIEHEDDLPEVRLLVDWIWPRAGAAGRRMLAVLAHIQGDHVDEHALGALARLYIGGRGPARRDLTRLRRWRILQEPLPGRLALHATVRHAVARRTRFDQRRAAMYTLALLEQDPSRLDLEQTHLFAAMDFAHTTSDLRLALRVDRLLERLGLA
jgi:hypothetical protein